MHSCFIIINIINIDSHQVTSCRHLLSFHDISLTFWIFSIREHGYCYIHTLGGGDCMHNYFIFMVLRCLYLGIVLLSGDFIYRTKIYETYYLPYQWLVVYIESPRKGRKWGVIFHRPMVSFLSFFRSSLPICAHLMGALVLKIIPITTFLGGWNPNIFVT